MNYFYKLITVVFIIFIVPSSLQEIGIFGVFPRSLGVIIVTILLLIHLKNISKINFVLIFYIFILGVTSILQSNNIQLNLKDYIYFVTFILFCTAIRYSEFLYIIEKNLFKNRKLIFFNIILMQLILLISIFSKQAYYKEWGDVSSYFTGFTPMPHVIASICFCLLLMIMFYYKRLSKKRKVNYLLIIPIICIFMSGARSYLLPTLILIIYYLSSEFGFKKIFLLIFCFSPIIIIFILNSSMVDKFIYAIEFEFGKESIISRLTSGRSDMWISLLHSYNENYNFLQKIIGSSFDTIYTILFRTTGMNVWAHNDIINTLMSSGLFGVITYLVSFKNIFKINRKFDKYSKRVFIVIYLLFMLTNGLFISAPLMISILFFMLVFTESKNIHQYES